MNEATIWRFLKSQGMTDAGAAGLMGNLFAESGLNPKNLQNSYEKKLGYTDATYTAAVDSGTYTNFVRDSAGYGLCQWTYWTRKQALYAFCKAISALTMSAMRMRTGFKSCASTGSSCRITSPIHRKTSLKLFQRLTSMSVTVESTRSMRTTGRCWQSRTLSGCTATGWRSTILEMLKKIGELLAIAGSSPSFCAVRL